MPHNNFNSELIKGRGGKHNTVDAFFQAERRKNIPVGGAGPSRLSKINSKPSGVLLCDFTRLPAVCRRFPSCVSLTTSEVQPDYSVLKYVINCQQVGFCHRLRLGTALKWSYGMEEMNTGRKKKSYWLMNKYEK